MLAFLPRASVRKNVMKALVTIFAVSRALVFTAPAFAQTIDTAKTKADCEKAGGSWSGRSCTRG